MGVLMWDVIAIRLTCIHVYIAMPKSENNCSTQG